MKVKTSRGYRDYQLPDGGWVFDCGEILVVVPREITLDGTQYHPLRGECGGWRNGITRKGREAIFVQPGRGCIFSAFGSAGSRSWCGWDSKYPDHPGIFSTSGRCSHGGGSWNEIWIYPERFGKDPNVPWLRPDPDRIQAELFQEEI